jgi:hypothetical protein
MSYGAKPLSWQDILVNGSAAMGGFGSTRWASAIIKDTVEGSRSLDINQLNRAGCLYPGYCGGWEWTRDGEQVASILLRRDSNALILSYRIRAHGGEWKDVEQSTPIRWTQCRFGGGRPYFVCRGVVNGVECGRRVTKLYGAGTYFLCRHCYCLAYASQREGPYDRALRRQEKIRMRLGGDPGVRSPYPDRPKRMHHKTYQRLMAEMWNAEMSAKAALGMRFRRVSTPERNCIGGPE